MKSTTLAHRVMLRLVLRVLNILRMLMRLVHCACSKQSGFLEWRKKRGFIKLAQANFTGLCKKHRNAKQRHFIHVAPMPWQSSMLIGFASIFARHTAFMPAMAYYSIMKAQGAVKPSSLAKSHAAFQTSPAVSSNASTWEILMPCAIGAMRVIMFGCSG